MRSRLVTAALLTLVSAAGASAQQRPLTTEDPLTIGAGRLLIEAGFEFATDQFYPASGLLGDRMTVPTLGLSVGIGSIAELQVDGAIFNHLSITDRFPAPLSRMLDIDGDSTTSVDDIVVATKVRLVGEGTGRPTIGLRFATKLPTAPNEKGLGLDTTDFFASLLIGKTVQSVRIVGNVGLGILGDPLRGDSQNDVLTYGFSLARAVTSGFELVGEINGRVSTAEGTPPPGTDTRGMMRFGGRYTVGAGRVDGAVMIGITDRDPDWGFTVGYTHVFNAFTVP